MKIGTFLTVAIQTVGKYGTDVHTPIQTVVQTNGKMVQTIQTVEDENLGLKLSILNSLYGLYHFPIGMYIGLYGGMYVCTIFPNGLHGNI